MRVQTQSLSASTGNSLISGGPEVRASSLEWFVEAQAAAPLNKSSSYSVDCWVLITISSSLPSAAVQFLWLHGDAAQEVHTGGDDWRE